MSVKDLAEKSKVPAQTIRRSAKTGCRPDTAGKIAGALDVPLSEIIVDEKEGK